MMQTAAATLVLLLFIGARAAEIDQCAAPTEPKAKYWLANVKSQHLAHVKDAFKRLGYELAADADDDWNVMWSFHSPFHQRANEPDNPAIIQRLQPHQMVNQLPGAATFSSKVRLAQASSKLDFLPRSFPLPAQADSFKAFADENPNVEWLLKDSKHRGVRFLGSSEALAEATASVVQDEEVFVQQLVRPYLIDKKLWDVGVYVAISSIDPLRVYFYDNLLLRHCAEDYVYNLSAAPEESYVVAEGYSPPWAIQALRPYYTRGYNTKSVLFSYMHDNGIDFGSILDEMKEQVVRLLHNFEPDLRDVAYMYPHGPRSFFGLYRCDFMIDRDLQPWLIEVNQSPNLSSGSTADLKNMFQRISFSLLNLMGFAPGQMRHPSIPDDHVADILVHHNDVDIGWRICSRCIDTCEGECVICRRCRTPEQTRMLQELISEHRNRQGFLRLYPLDSEMSSRTRLQELADPGENDYLQRIWIRERCFMDRTWC